MGQMGGGPDISSEREISAGGDFAAGLGPTHYGSGPLPLQADEDLVIESASSTAHTITFSNRGGGSVATGTRPLAAGGSLLVRGRGISAITIDSADSSVTWAKGAAGTVWPVNPSIAGGASTVSDVGNGHNVAPNANTTTQMGGLGSILALTPKKTGKVRVTVMIFASSSTDGNLLSYLLAYGTGAAPSKNAAATGTPGSTYQLEAQIGASGAYKACFAATCVFTGLTVGTAYWFDLQLYVTNTAEDSFSAYDCSVEELPS